MGNSNEEKNPRVAEVVNLAAYRKAKVSKEKPVNGSEYALKPGSFADVVKDIKETQRNISRTFDAIISENEQKKKRQDEERLKANQRKAQTVKKGGLI